MDSNIQLLSVPSKESTLNLSVTSHDGVASLSINAVDGDTVDYFHDVNAAFRMLNARSKGLKTPSFSIRPPAETLSAPVPGLRETLALIGHLLPTESLTPLLDTWDTQYEIIADDLQAFGISNGPIPILQETSEHGRLLTLQVVQHPAKDKQATNRLALRLTSYQDEGGSLTAESVEYFYDISLAVRAFEMRLANDTQDTTGLGMEGGFPRAHLEYRNGILTEDAISISRDDATKILHAIVRSDQYDECAGLFYQLRDAHDAIYSGNLVKWLGSVVVQPDGSGIYSKGRTKPFEMFIKVEVPKEEIERNDDGTIDFALCYFSGLYNFDDWHEANQNYQDLPYTDMGIQKSVNNFLATLGFEGKVDWSEHGRQTPGEADFDMDYELIDEIWPELRHEVREATVVKPC
jgi:hypothetical protein